VAKGKPEALAMAESLELVELLPHSLPQSINQRMDVLTEVSDPLPLIQEG
jgi:hypothetical protein